MPRPKRWTIAAASELAAPLAAALRVSPLVAQVLVNRGVTTADAGSRFLNPSLKDLHEPAAMANLEKAAARIAQAITAREKIVIYGDYDVDGITSTAILWHAIRLLGGEVDYYIPHRLEEGYGLNAEALRQIADGGAKLILSVDCGVTAIDEVKSLQGRDVTVIISDHHEWRHAEDGLTPMLPDCFTIVHPRLTDGASGVYPNPNLCGAGVAFKLAWGVGLAASNSRRVSEPFKRFLCEATALAALGTIADVVPLTGENRVLAHFGLKGLKASNLTGIQALIASANLVGEKLDSYHVGFLLAPRINASGRMGHARLAVEMLTTATPERANEIAAYLEQQNRARQAMEKQIFEEAMAQVRELKLDTDDTRGVVLGKEGWHPGVIGIVASRVVGRLHRPTVMVAITNGHGQGSARSIAGFHLARALDACRQHLEGCGGHEMAAGLRLETSHFEAFRAAFAAHAAQHVSVEMLRPELRIDATARLEELTQGMVVDLSRLGPFGTSNPAPLLACEGVEVVGSPRRVGRNGEHLQLLVRQGATSIKCIAFGMGESAEALPPGTRVDIAGQASINTYNGKSNVELEVKDLRPV